MYENVSSDNPYPKKKTFHLICLINGTTKTANDFAFRGREVYFVKFVVMIEEDKLELINNFNYT